MIIFCVFMFVFTERGGDVVRTRPKKRLNPDELRSFNISMSMETKLLDTLHNIEDSHRLLCEYTNLKYTEGCIART